MSGFGRCVLGLLIPAEPFSLQRVLREGVCDEVFVANSLRQTLLGSLFRGKFFEVKSRGAKVRQRDVLEAAHRFA